MPTASLTDAQLVADARTALATPLQWEQLLSDARARTLATSLTVHVTPRGYWVALSETAEADDGAPLDS